MCIHKSASLYVMTHHQTQVVIVDKIYVIIMRVAYEVSHELVWSVIQAVNGGVCKCK